MATSRFSDTGPRRPHLTRRGQGGVPGEVRDLRDDTDTGFSDVETALDELVTLLVNGSPLLHGIVRLNFRGAGINVSIDSMDPTQLNIELNGYAGNTTNAYISTVDTSALVSGQFGYIIDNNRLVLTDAASSTSSIATGIYTGTPDNVLRIGVFDTVKFSSASPIPVPNSPIFLSRADEEPSNGAAGKVTVTPPTNSFVAQVGQVLSVNATQFLTDRTAKCLVHVYGIRRLL